VIETSTNTLKVLTINIWNRQGAFEQRAKQLRAGIEQLAPDVIGLQEVMSDGVVTLSDEVLDGLGYNHVFGTAKELPGGIFFGNGAASRWPISLEDVVALPGGGTDQKRSLMICEVQCPFGTLPFLVTHLAWKFHHGFIREQQVQHIAQVMRERVPIETRSLPAVLVGDFNARPDATEIRFLTGLHALSGQSIYLADCFAEVGEEPGYTFDRRHNPYAALSPEPPRRIDYIFVRGPDKLRRGTPLSAKVVLDEVRENVACSDHYGVFAEIGM